MKECLAVWTRALARGLALVLLLGTVLAPPLDARAARHGNGGPDVTRLVDLFTGTAAGGADFGTGGGAGNTFPGAVMPFGMVQWSPDTSPGRTNSPGGYSYEDTEIRGFSLTHLSGVGCPIFQDFPFLPTTVPVDVSPALPRSYLVEPRYLPSFDHARERAEPGYYRVDLDPDTPQAIGVELSATTRTGFARIRYPETATASVLINAGGSAMANGTAVFRIDPARREVSGQVESGQFCYHRNRYTVFLVAEFDRDFAAYGTWTKQALAPGATASEDHADSPSHLRPITGLPNPPAASNGAQAGAYVTFDARAEQRVQVRVGLSFVSVEGARENLRAESRHLRFDDVRRRARRQWNRLLSRVHVHGGDRADRRTFYTMLYHALLAPTVASDANGASMGMDGQPHAAAGFTRYTNFSGWDIYRSQIPLLAMLDPMRVSDMIRSLLADARESGWLPKWSVASGQTNVMVGDPAAPIIAGAYAFGALDFDHGEALAAMLKGATEYGASPNADYVERAALPAYVAAGWVPHEGTEGSSGASTSLLGTADAVWGSAATTLEYAVADFAIARFAGAIGRADVCAAFATRAANWRHVFNPATGYVQPRRATGEFAPAFDPAGGEGFAEGNASQYTWMVPHDLGGLIEAVGGRVAATERLDAFFTELNAGPTSRFAFLGNEPSFHTPWIYGWLGAPEKSQAVVRRALLTLFDAAPTGYPGNDDMGQMSAWYVLGALGLSPVIPGTDVLALGTPLFPRVDVRRPRGTITIVGRGAGRSRPYVHALRVDGRAHRRPWIAFADLARGARLAFTLGATPGTWGTAPGDAPPSFPPEHEAVCRAGALGSPG
jgi:predicted alpha-1,2-mannosidase